MRSPSQHKNRMQPLFCIRLSAPFSGVTIKEETMLTQHTPPSLNDLSQRLAPQIARTGRRPATATNPCQPPRRTLAPNQPHAARTEAVQAPAPRHRQVRPLVPANMQTYRPNRMGIRGISDGPTISVGITPRFRDAPVQRGIVMFCLTPTRWLVACVFCRVHLAGWSLILCLGPNRCSKSGRF
jgi:hypothetical protein